MVAVLGILYAQLLGQPIETYLPYLALGLIIWQFISSCMIEGGMVLISQGLLIKQIKIPLTTHVSRCIWRNFVILLHSLPVMILFVFVFNQKISLSYLLVPFGLLIILLNGLWVGIVFGIISARYRDLPPIIQSLVQVSFFFTPVMWMPEILESRGWIAQYNPFYHLIELVRAPLLGRPIQYESWIFSLFLLVPGFAFAQHLMKRARNKVPYWV